MMIVARGMGYTDIVDRLKGKKVALWTCNTCARMCRGIGGSDAVGRMAGKLREDGIDVVSVGSTSASCIVSKVFDRLSGDFDVILSLTCDIGSRCVGDVYRCDVIEPLVTLGSGFLGADGVPMVRDNGGYIPLEEAASSRGLEVGPYV